MDKAARMICASSRDDGTLPDAACRGCFFCKSGKEEAVVQRFRTMLPNGKAVAPTRIRHRRTGDTTIEERVFLLPGYVFFEIDAETATGERMQVFQNALQALSHGDSVLKLLRYSDDDWRLHGPDDQFAKMLLSIDGDINVSHAYFDEGRRIRILDGFLKDYEGSIVRVNKKNRTVEINVAFQQKKVSMWLGYEMVEAAR